MGWPFIPDLIMTDWTAWRKVASWSTDKALGRVPTYGPEGPAVPCAVDTSSASMVDAHGRQAMVVQHRVTFREADFPGLHIRDQGTWFEGCKTLTVTGIEPIGDANGRAYVVTCEERPTL